MKRIPQKIVADTGNCVVSKETKAKALAQFQAAKAPKLPPLRKVPVRKWYGCYGKSWKGMVPDQVFTHPAKFSYLLIDRIYTYGREIGAFGPGDVIGDPFGGVALGGFVAGQHGLAWIGNELEPAFVRTGRLVLAVQALKAPWIPLPPARLLQGDSRFFAEAVSGIVTSPPFTMCHGGGKGINVDGYVGKDGKQEPNLGKRHYQGDEGERSEGNIETLPHGHIAAFVSSPPYETINSGNGGLNHLPAQEGQQGGRANGASQTADSRYGNTAGQIAKARPGGLEAVVSSPPWEDNATGCIGADRFKDAEGFAARMVESGKGNPATVEARVAQFERDKAKHYGQEAGQIGKTSGETYWEAMNAVYRSCYAALKPGGYMFIVVKDYAKDWQRVRLCDNTQRLLEAIGFVTQERIHAMLSKPKAHHKDMFDATHDDAKETTAKSFFRRTYEKKKGAVKIDYEEVIIVRKPPIL